MAQLKLFHHFTTVTGPSISVGEMSQEIFTATVPRIALSYKFLMHALLAVSALHIAHINPVLQDHYCEPATTDDKHSS